MIAEVAIWLTRILSFLPELISLWEAAKSPDPQEQLEASLALVRKIKDQQAAEEIGAP